MVYIEGLRFGDPLICFLDLSADTNSLPQEIPLHLRLQPGYLAASVPVSPLELFLSLPLRASPGKTYKVGC